MNFKFLMESKDKQDLLKLFGDIDENSSFNDVESLGNNQLVIDLQGVRNINSIGLRTWVLWVRTLTKYKGGIILRNCPNVVVNQINILDGFLPLNAIVESIQIPFYCESCEYEEIYLAKRGIHYKESTADQDSTITARLERICVKCGELMELDIIPTKYFMFLNKKIN